MTQPTAHCIFVSPASKVTMPQLVRPCRLVVTSGTGIVRRYQPDTLNGERTRRRGPLHLRLEVSLSALNKRLQGLSGGRRRWRSLRIIQKYQGRPKKSGFTRWYIQATSTASLSPHTPTHTHTHT